MSENFKPGFDEIEQKDIFNHIISQAINPEDAKRIKAGEAWIKLQSNFIFHNQDYIKIIIEDDS